MGSWGVVSSTPFEFQAVALATTFVGHLGGVFGLGCLGVFSELGILDAGMIDVLQPLDEYTLGSGDVEEGDGTFGEESVLYL